MHRLLLAASLMAATAAAAGCLGGAGEALVDCSPLVNVSLFHPAGTDGDAITRADGGSFPVVVWTGNLALEDVETTVRIDAEPVRRIDPAGPTPDARTADHTLAEGEQAFTAFQVGSAFEGDEVTVTVSAETPGLGPDLRDRLCSDAGPRQRSLDVEVQPVGDVAEGGKGVLVRTVGWWTNGSSFYTNMARYHERPDLPQGYLGPYNGSEPLKVYVYNETGDEMPQRYNESGYLTTIPGFNEALKGLPTVGGRIAYLEPGEAYTTEGNEEHPLYGDALVFYIEALEVRRVDCEVPQPVCTPPDGPTGPWG